MRRRLWFLASFTSIILVVFAQMSDVDVSMISVSPWRRRLQVPFSSRSAQLEVVCQCQQLLKVQLR